VFHQQPLRERLRHRLQPGQDRGRHERSRSALS
jgi:hypothetical protein